MHKLIFKALALLGSTSLISESPFNLRAILVFLVLTKLLKNEMNFSY